MVASIDEVQHELSELQVASHRVPGLPDGLVLEAPFDVHGSALWGRGAVMAQSRGSMRVGQAVGAAPGERVLDLCAAPGAKTTQIAAGMDNQGALVAVERHPGRARALDRTLARMKVDCGAVRIGDAAAVEESGETYDRVLVDPPCSGLGTLQSRPDLRWRTNPERICALVGLQARILRAGAAVTRPGGTLVYSVCTISRAESERLIGAFLDERPEFGVEPVHGSGTRPWLQLTPHHDGTDGFFIACLRRDPAAGLQR